MKTIKCAECNEPKLEKLLYCEKHLKDEYARYFNEHTPTPWSFANDEIYARNSRIIHVCVRDDMQDKNDAEFIVRAVNSHEELMSVLKMVADSGPLNNGMRDENTMQLVRAAIAKAEGK